VSVPRDDIGVIGEDKWKGEKVKMIINKRKLIFIVSFFALSLFFIYQETACEGFWRPGLGKNDYRMSVRWLRRRGDYGPGDYGRKIRFERRRRFYKIHVPPSYKKGKPMPVVLIFHGGGSYPGAVRYESGMDEVADKEGFIVVYPAGTGIFFNDRLLTWNDGRSLKNGSISKVDDVGFVKALLDDLATFFNIDTKRIYAAGFSNGAQFTYRLAKQLSDRIAAVSLVAGHRSANQIFPPPSRPISLMQFSGLEDKVAPYHGGTPNYKYNKFKTAYQPVGDAIETWVLFNRCPSKPIDIKRIGRAVKTLYGPGKNGTEVILWTLEDGGHTWPGGRVVAADEKFNLGNVNTDISASELMWEFFKKQ